MNKKSWKRTIENSLCILLAAVLFISNVDLTVFAAETSTQAVKEMQQYEVETETIEETQTHENAETPEEQEKSEEIRETESVKETGLDSGSQSQETSAAADEKQSEIEMRSTEEQSEEEAQSTEEQSEEEAQSAEEQSEEETQSTEMSDSATLEAGDMKAHSTNSFGRLFANSINGELAEKVEDTGCDIFSITVDGTTASVTFQTLEDGVLVVGVYEDDGVKLLATGSVEVSRGDTEVKVPIETDSLPQYFCLKGYLAETNSLRPLCTVYENIDYTEKMQQFFAKTTDDFNNDKIINLDKDKTNNFLVFKEEVTVIQRSSDESVNKVVECDEDNLVYTIENADETIAGLTEGTIFAYYYDVNEAIIAKVESVETLENEEGRTVTIHGDAKADLGDIFAYIKIGAENPRQSEQGAYAVSARETSVKGHWEYGFSYPADSDDGSEKLPEKPTFADRIDGSKSAEISVGGHIGGDNTLQIYSEEESAVEWVNLEIAYEVGVNVSLGGSVDGELLLGHVDLPTSVPGVLIAVNLKLFIEAEAEIELSGTLTGGAFRVNIKRDKAVELHTDDPHFESSPKIEGSITFGLKVEAGVKAIHEKIASVTVSALGGVELDASCTIWEGSTGEEENEEELERHACKCCFDGDTYFVVSLETEAEIMTKKIGPVKLGDGVGAKIKLNDFYYSIDRDEAGFGECPYKEYQIAVTVFQSTSSLKPVEGARINDEVDTNKKGQASLWLPSDIETHRISVIYNGKRSLHERKVSNNRIVFIYLDTGHSTDDPVVKAVLNAGCVAAITKSGKLYIWGKNTWGQIGNGTVENQYEPVRILESEKVRDVKLDDRNTAVITEDGKLYIWGAYGPTIGNGTTEDQYEPLRILENEKVRDVKLDNGNTVAITEDGKLYMWGRNEFGQIGNGTTENQYEPLRILGNEKVRDVKFDCYNNYTAGTTAAITEDRKLYMWGSNSFGEIGNGMTEEQYEPLRILGNEKVRDVKLDNGTIAAITEDGKLYMWGGNNHGQIGNGTREEQYEPVRILEKEKVSDVNVDGGTTAAITEDGKLYMWGSNGNGQIGNGTTEEQLEPIRILENEKVNDVKTFLGITMAAITEDGKLYMWGSNGNGQIGNGVWSDQREPLRILEKENVSDVNVIEYTTAAITEDGKLYMCGDNHYGQIGNGTTEDALTPQIVDLTKSNLSTESKAISSENQSILTARNTSDSFGSPAEFDNLLPNETYNFYAMQSKEGIGADRVSSDNLLYIGQYVSDGDGRLRIPYETAKTYETIETLLVGMTRTDLAAAEVTVAELVADGKEQFVDVSVTYKGQTLMPGIDYGVTGDCIVKKEGEYKITINGIGIYNGKKEVSFRVKKQDSQEKPSEPESGSESGSESEPEEKPSEPEDESGPEEKPSEPEGESRPEEKPSEPEDESRPEEKPSEPESGSEPETGGESDTGNGDVLAEDIPADGKIPEGLWIAGIVSEGYAYTGNAIKPNVRIYDHTTLLTEKKDYTISYKNNIKANTASAAAKAPIITVKGKGNYSGKETAEFRILAQDIATDAFDADDMAIAYNAKKSQKPLAALWWNGKSLKNNKDYTVAYYDSAGTKKLDAVKDVGTYYLEFTGIGNFTGTRRVSLTVSDSVLMINKAAVTKIGNQTYTGSEIRPELTVKDGKNMLTENTHYTVKYKNNINIGTAYAIITGIGTYSGTKRIAFPITGPSITKATVEIPEQVFNGTVIKPEPELTLKVNGNMLLLSKDTDYLIKWQNNRNAGTATVIFNGINGYSGTLKKTFKIQPFNIDTNPDNRFTVLMDNSAPYAKGGAKPELTVSFKSGNGLTQKLIPGTDYTITYKNNTTVNGNAMLTIKGKGNFSGTMPLTYQVVKQDIAKLKLTPEDKVYQNRENTYSTKVVITDVDGKALSAGKDFDKIMTYTYKNDTTLESGALRAAGTVVGKEDIIPAGTVITVTALAAENGNYMGTVSGDYRITQASVSSAKITVPEQIYTGKEITLTEEQITVMVKGQKLSTDQYQILADSYKNNVKKGNASVTIQGKGNYGGTKTVQFKIKTKGFFWWWKKK